MALRDIDDPQAGDTAALPSKHRSQRTKKPTTAAGAPKGQEMPGKSKWAHTNPLDCHKSTAEGPRGLLQAAVHKSRLTPTQSKLKQVQLAGAY